MKNFKKYLAWQDGELGARERARFEAQLSPGEREEAKQWEAIRGALRAQDVPPLNHPDFLNARVREAIEKSATAPRLSPLPSLKPLLGWSFALIFSALLLAVLWLPQEMGLRSEEEFISQVIEARAGTPQMSVTSFRAPDSRGVVIWIEGTDYIPPEAPVR